MLAFREDHGLRESHGKTRTAAFHGVPDRSRAHSHGTRPRGPRQFHHLDRELPNVTATDSFDGASVKLPQPIPVDQNDCTTPFIAGATTSTLRGPWYRNPLSAVTVLHADMARA